MKAIGNFLVVEPIAKEQKPNIGGLIIPVALENDIRYLKAKVISKGDAVEAPVNEGDIIFYDKHAGHKIPLGDIEHKVITQNDIVVKL